MGKHLPPWLLRCNQSFVVLLSSGDEGEAVFTIYGALR
jgi:hypothetical protein